MYKDPDLNPLYTANLLCDLNSGTSLLWGLDWSLGSLSLWNYVSWRACQLGKQQGWLLPDLPPWAGTECALWTYQSTWAAWGSIMIWLMDPPWTGASAFPCQLRERKEKKHLTNKIQAWSVPDKKIFCWWQHWLPYNREKINRNLGLAVMAGLGLMKKERRLGVRDAGTGREAGSGVSFPYLQHPSKDALSSATPGNQIGFCFFHGSATPTSARRPKPTRQLSLNIQLNLFSVSC